MFKTYDHIFIKIKDTIMNVLAILVTLLIIGIILWVVNNFIPMDEKIKKLLNAIVIILVIIWILKGFGVMHFLQSAFN